MSLPRYPLARWIPAHGRRWRAAPGRVPKRVILHITDGHARVARQTAQNVWANPPAPGDAATAAHFVVGQDLAVVQAVDLDAIAWHAHGASLDSIGIEVQARRKGEDDRDDPGMPPTPGQLDVLAELVAWCCAVCGITPSRRTILGHAEADPSTTHADCPTACVDLEAVAERVCAVAAARAGAATATG